MSGRDRHTGRRAQGEFTFTEAARREQIIGLTIGLIAEHGFRGATLAKIAEAAGLSNAAVLYFFGTKNAVLQSACERVMTNVIEVVSAAVGAATSAREAIDAYVRALVGYMAEHRSHTRAVIEMVTGAPPGLLEAATGSDDPATERWRPMADLIDHAILDGDIRTLDSRTTAITPHRCDGRDLRPVPERPRLRPHHRRRRAPRTLRPRTRTAGTDTPGP